MSKCWLCLSLFVVCIPFALQAQSGDWQQLRAAWACSTGPAASWATV